MAKTNTAHAFVETNERGALDFGPAEVVALEPRGARVRVEDGREVLAISAFVVAYEPAIGDELLVVGSGDRYFAIGVVRGAGKLALSIDGDVDLRAKGGELRLSGDKGVRIAGEEIDVVATKLKLAAGAALETFASLVTRVSGVLSVHAKDAHTVVDNASLTTAKRAAITTEETVTINGKQVHLG